jgi:hypothetical protein
MTGLRVAQLAASDAASAGALLTASHGEYPAFRATFPDPRVRRRFLLPFQTAAARDVAIHGRLVGAFLDDQLAGSGAVAATRTVPGQEAAEGRKPGTRHRS